MRYQRCFAWISLIGFALGAAIALTGSMGARFGLWDVPLGIKILTPGVAIGAVALAAGLIWAGRALWHNESTGGRIGAIGLIGAGILVGIPSYFLLQDAKHPPIHDVSSDIGEPPQFHILLAWRAGAPNPPDYDGPKQVKIDGAWTTVSLAQHYAYSDIRPMEKLDANRPQQEMVDAYFERALQAIDDYGWQLAGYDRKAGRIEAVSRSFWLGNPSDIVIRVRPTGQDGVQVDVRAKSRYGEGDGGRNAELVRKLLSKMWA